MQTSKDSDKAPVEKHSKYYLKLSGVPRWTIAEILTEHCKK